MIEGCVSADEVLVALLDRVVQQMFLIRFQMHAIDSAKDVDDLPRITNQLDAVVNDIRTTVVTWQFGDEDGLAGDTDSAEVPPPGALTSCDNPARGAELQDFSRF